MTITLKIVGITFLLIYYLEVFSQATKIVGFENEIILALGKPGKQKTKFLSTENLNQINEVEENWSISNALGLYSEKQSRFFVFGGYNDATGTLFEKTLELENKTNGLIEAEIPGLPKLKLPRTMAAIAKVGDSSWWITGGLSEDGSTNSTEVFNEALLLPNKMDDGPTLPFQIYGHCMLTLPNDSVRNIITIGGFHGRIDENMGISSDVWYFMDPLKHNYEATLLNSLNEPRMQHSCGIMRKNKNEDKFIAVVAGGYNGFKSLDSVEILEFDKEEGGIYSKWVKQSQTMPIALHGGSILPNIDCTNLYFFGGKSYEKGIVNTILLYNGEDWSFANQNMTRRRSDFVISQMNDGIKCTDF